MATNGSTTNKNISFNRGLKSNNLDNFKLNYSPFLGGLNTTNAALSQYDPLRTGRARLFMVKRPVFMDRYLAQHNMEKMSDIIQHMFEYGFTSVGGIGELSLETEGISGGYVAKEFEIGKMSKDSTSSLTIGLYEWSGSPMHEYIKLWITGISDPETGFGTYHGARVSDAADAPFLRYRQDHHTAEFIYCVTDPTGRSDALEYACLFTNCMPKSITNDHFNFDKGDSKLVEMSVEFTTNKYESPDINEMASRLVAKHNVLKDSLNFKSGYNFGLGNAYDLSTRIDNITGVSNPDDIAGQDTLTAADANWANVRGSNTIGAEDNHAWDWDDLR